MQTKPRFSSFERIKQGGRLCREGAILTFQLLQDPQFFRRSLHFLSGGPKPVLRVFWLIYIETHNTREIKTLMDDHEPITFVSSFARSGNTWMRYLLSDVFLQNQGIDTTTNLAVHPDEIIADFYRSRIADRSRTVSTPGVLIKIHDSFSQLRNRFSIDKEEDAVSFEKCRHLYLYRSPEDALVSLYHYHIREGLWLDAKLKNAGPYEMDAFCRAVLPVWIAHVSGYLEAAENRVPIYFVSYDKLLRGTPAVLGEVLVWLGVPHTQTMLERAAMNMQFTKLKATNARDIGHHGRSGAGSAQLQPATVEFIREKTADLMVRLNRRANYFPTTEVTAPVPAYRTSFNNGAASGAVCSPKAA